MKFFVSVYIVEDDIIIRQHLIYLLERAEGVKVAKAYASAEEVLDDKGALEGVILVDVHLPKLCGIDLVRVIKGKHPNLKPLFMSASNNGSTIRKAMQAGGCGYLIKPAKPAELILAIFETAGGGFPMSKDTMRAFIEDLRSGEKKKESNCAIEEKTSLLTTMEKEIHQHVLLGCTSKIIASRMGISESTVNTHIQHIFQKFNVCSRAELCALILSHCRTCNMGQNLP